jgi:muramidase (phage lysozyme)
MKILKVTKKRVVVITIMTLLTGIVTLNTSLIYPRAYHFESSSIRGALDSVQQNINLRAFLAAVASQEVGRHNVESGKGYHTMFGHTVFKNLDHHPGTKVTKSIIVHGKRKNVSSSAAGAYQMLASTDEDVAIQTGIKSFHQEDQNKKATFLLWERHCLLDVLRGNFDNALKKANKLWASLPGAPYGQRTITHEKFCSDLIYFLRKFGAKKKYLRHLRCGNKSLTSYQKEEPGIAKRVYNDIKWIAKKLTKPTSKNARKKSKASKRVRPHKRKR